MKRKLLKQINNEWRSNLWLVIEMVIISAVLFYVADMVTTRIRIFNMPLGYDIENTYQILFGERAEATPGYRAPQPRDGETDKDARLRLYHDTFQRIIDRLRNTQGVEAVTFSTFLPYSYNYWGEQFQFINDDPADSVKVNIATQLMEVDPDFPRVFRIRGLGGESPEQLSEMLRQGKTLVADNISDSPWRKLINRQLMNIYDETASHLTISGVIPKIRRNAAESFYWAGVMVPMEKIEGNMLYFRLKDGADKSIVEKLMAANSPINIDNIYVIEIKSFDRKATDLHRNDRMMLVNLMTAMGFLLLTVFLGVLGTFWFRTQQRVREIAIRRVEGATRGQIFRRLMGEGLLLLAIATPLAWIIDWLFYHYGLTSTADQTDIDTILYLVSDALGVVLMMILMIVGGIFFPARKAMAVEPADVLRGE